MKINHNREFVFYEKPYRHWVCENFFSKEDADALCDHFPKPTNEWWKYQNHFEKKFACDRLELLPAIHHLALMMLNHNPWMKELEELTGISGLIPDPALRGGGAHCILPGGNLGVHLDFNYHRHLKLHRRLNLLVYLNRDWKEEYNGALELWSSDMSKCEKKYFPILNRCVIFETTDWSPHGHPDSLECPEGMSRNSLALYYYSSERPEHEITPHHSTMFKKRPGEETSEEIEALRLKRNEGRL